MKLEVDGMNEARNATSVICSAYDSFFEAEKKIADFLIEHKAEAAGMTVGSWAGPARPATLRCHGSAAAVGLRDSRI